MLPSEFMISCLYKSCSPADIAVLQQLAIEINRRAQRNIVSVGENGSKGSSIQVNEKGAWLVDFNLAVAIVTDMDAEVRDAA